MADAIRLEIKNLDEVLRAIKAAGEAGAAAMSKGVEAGGKVLQGKVSANAPGPGIGLEIDGLTAYVGPDAAHWYYLFFETGTSAHLVAPRSKRALKFGDTFAARAFPRGVAAQPFLRPAVDEGVDEVSAAVGKEILAAID
jgi:hypothetical protein